MRIGGQRRKTEEVDLKKVLICMAVIAIISFGAGQLFCDGNAKRAGDIASKVCTLGLVLLMILLPAKPTMGKGEE